MVDRAQKGFAGAVVVSMDEMRDTVTLNRATEEICCSIAVPKPEYHNLLRKLKEDLRDVDLRKVSKGVRKDFANSLKKMCSKSYDDGNNISILLVWNVLGFNGGLKTGRNVGKLIFN